MGRVVAHEILETAQSINSLFGFGAWTLDWDLDSGLSIWNRDTGPRWLLVCSNRQGRIPGIVRLVARLNILYDAFVALKAISDFWVKCWGRGRILGFMIDSLATLNISEVGKYKTF